MRLGKRVLLLSMAAVLAIGAAGCGGKKDDVITITNVSYTYPLVQFTTHVGSGTYIRSLAVDIGIALNTGAYMSALRRISIGEITLGQAVAITDITEEYLQQTLQK